VATAVTMYLSFLGTDGLQKVAASCVNNTQKLISLLEKVPGVSLSFGRTVFHEFVVALDVDVDQVLERLAEEDIVGGINISQDYAQLNQQKNLLLICVTETKTDEDLVFFASTLENVLKTIREGQ
jgi:glycine dehydrogenase subunit 1